MQAKLISELVHPLLASSELHQLAEEMDLPLCF